MSRPQFFRANVGVLVIDAAGRALALERRDTPGSWQLPQGGLHEGEEPLDGALRELGEETGLGPADVELVAELPEWLAYELPPAYRSARTGRGQVQRWFAFRARRDLPAAALAGDGHEAVGFAWLRMRDLIAGVVAFRRPVYERVAAAFASLLAP